MLQRTRILGGSLPSARSPHSKHPQVDIKDLMTLQIIIVIFWQKSLIGFHWTGNRRTIRSILIENEVLPPSGGIFHGLGTCWLASQSRPNTENSFIHQKLRALTAGQLPWWWWLTDLGKMMFNFSLLRRWFRWSFDPPPSLLPPGCFTRRIYAPKLNRTVQCLNGNNFSIFSI